MLAGLAQRTTKSIMLRETLDIPVREFPHLALRQFGKAPHVHDREWDFLHHPLEKLRKHSTEHIRKQLAHQSLKERFTDRLYLHPNQGIGAVQP